MRFTCPDPICLASGVARVGLGQLRLRIPLDLELDKGQACNPSWTHGVIPGTCLEFLGSKVCFCPSCSVWRCSQPSPRHRGSPMENKPHTEGDSTDASPEHLDPVLSKAKAPRASLSWSSLSCKPQRGYMDLTRPRHAAPSSLGLTQPRPPSLAFLVP